MISTPKVLKRELVELPEEFKDKITNTTFRYFSLNSGIDIQVSTTVLTILKKRKNVWLLMKKKQKSY